MTWAYFTNRRRDERITELEQLVARPSLLVDLARMNERTGLLAAVTLWELSLADGLDGLQRVSPERAARIIEKARRRK